MSMISLRCTVVVPIDPSECRSPGYPMFKNGTSTLGILYGVLPSKRNLKCGIVSKNDHWIFRNCKYCEYRVLRGISKAKIFSH